MVALESYLPRPFQPSSASASSASMNETRPGTTPPREPRGDAAADRRAATLGFPLEPPRSAPRRRGAFVVPGLRVGLFGERDLFYTRARV